MKTFTTSALGVVLLASNVAAFPAAALDALSASFAKEGANTKRATSVVAPQGTGYLPLVPPPFDAAAQYVSNKGQYAFVAPGPGDARGMCPGLNAMANQFVSWRSITMRLTILIQCSNYLPHNGVATISQFISATNKVFGMAFDLGGFLAFFGAIVDGDGAGWSIDGGPHVGIGGSHNDYDSDSSPFMSDLNQYGSNKELVISQFKTFYDMQPDAATANYNLDVLTAFSGKRYTESINKNPYFFYGPFPGILVSQAAFTFKYRFMANKSAEYPEGILNKDVLKSFSSVSGPDNNLTWTPGHERIPDNWYKRNDADQYSIPYFFADVVRIGQTQPERLVIGCNHGAVNTFNAIDPATISNGAYTAGQVAASPLCFATEFALAELIGTTGLSAAQLAPLTSSLQNVTKSMNCQSIGSVNMSALTACPGFSFYGGPTGPIAPGAIQS
ncbi:hypothetical protein LTR85_011117 [Meristemomyces frigidus]|nr:hypothetical protein LTR85_011117 [Meristemomyces frigidus]